MGKETMSHVLMTPPGQVHLADYDSRATPGFEGKKSDSPKAMKEVAGRLETLQERLFACGRSGGTKRLLLVLQGMDTSGKGGVLRHVGGLVDPQGIHIASFKAPTHDELSHDFLWRIDKQLPGPGMVGIFDRSHYEDVLIARVRQLVDEAEIERRYTAINDFEQTLAEGGVTVVKCFLHITPDDQKERLGARLDDPTKHWKYNPGDVDERDLWVDYQHAYETALERCRSDAAPWFLIPSGRKWYRNLAVARLLAEQMGRLDLEWPPADFDVEAEKARLTAS